MQRREALDFLAVTDHSENLGAFNALEDPNSPISKSDVGKLFKSLQAVKPETQSEPSDLDRRYTLSWDYFIGSKNKLPDNLKPEMAAAWAREIDFANRHYKPGKFTTFIAYEWTAIPNRANLHRNVIFKGDSAPNRSRPWIRNILRTSGSGSKQFANKAWRRWRFPTIAMRAMA